MTDNSHLLIIYLLAEYICRVDPKFFPLSTITVLNNHRAEVMKLAQDWPDEVSMNDSIEGMFTKAFNKGGLH